MKILVVCDHGSSRSPHIADKLRWLGNETIPVGVEHISSATMAMLREWADKIIYTDPRQMNVMDPGDTKYEVWRIPDVFPRPYNSQLDSLLKRMLSMRAGQPASRGAHNA